MDKIEYLKIKKMVEKVLREPRYSWMVDSDVLLSKEDFIQEIFVKYLSSKTKADYRKETHLYTFVASRIKDIKRDIDRRHACTKEELYEDLPFVDSNHLRVAVRDSLNELNKVGTVSEVEVSMLFSKFIYGNTFSDIAVEFGYSHKANAEKKINRLVKRLTPEFKELLSNIKGVDMC